MQAIQELQPQVDKASRVKFLGIDFGNTLAQPELPFIDLSVSTLQRTYPWLENNLTHLNPQDRRHARSMLFEHLNQQGRLISSLQRAFLDLPSNVTVYVITSLASPVSALIIDIAVLLRRVSAIPNIKPRLMLYCTTEDAKPADSYAMLRELQRLSTNGHTEPLSFVLGSENPVLDGNVGKLYDAVYLYEPPDRPTDLSVVSVMSDTVLLHLDGEYGNFLAGRNENVGERIAMAQNQDGEHTFYVSIRQANTLLLPRSSLYQQLVPRYMHGALNAWVGTDAERLNAEQTAYKLLQQWANNQLWHPEQDTGIGCPTWVREIIHAQQANTVDHLVEEYATMSVERMVQLYVPAHLESAPQITSVHRDALWWRPSTKVSSPQNNQATRIAYSRLEEALLDQFETIENDQSRGGVFAKSVAAFQSLHLQEFVHSVKGLMQYVLHQPAGIVVLKALMEQLASYMETLSAVLQRAHKRCVAAGFEHMPDMPVELRRRGSRIKRLRRRTLLGVLTRTEEYEQLLVGADEIWEQCASEHLLFQWRVIADTWKAYIGKIQQALIEWLRILLIAPGNLNTTVSGLIEDNPLQEDPRWLISIEQLEKQLQQILDAATFADDLRWHIDLRLKSDRLQEVRFEPLLADERPLLKSQFKDWSSVNTETVKKYATKRLEQHLDSWTAWDWVFSEDATFGDVHWVAERLSSPPLFSSVTPDTKQVWTLDFIRPSMDTLPSKQLSQASQIAHMLEQNAYQQFPHRYNIQLTSDDSHLALMIGADVIDLNALQNIAAWRSAYRRHPRPESLHVFQAEQQAAYYERHVLPKKHELSNRVVRLLVLPISAFTWAYAAGVLVSIPGIPGHLNIDTADPIELAEAFLKDWQAERFSLDELQQWVDDWIHNEIQLMRQQESPEPRSDIWRWAQGLKHSNSAYYEDAVFHALAHDIMAAFYERCNESINNGNGGQDQRDLLLILGTTAQDEMQKKRLTVRQWMH